MPPTIGIISPTSSCNCPPCCTCTCSSSIRSPNCSNNSHSPNISHSNINSKKYLLSLKNDIVAANNANVNSIDKRSDCVDSFTYQHQHQMKSNGNGNGNGNGNMINKSSSLSSSSTTTSSTTPVSTYISSPPPALTVIPLESISKSVLIDSEKKEMTSGKNDDTWSSSGNVNLLEPSSVSPTPTVVTSSSSDIDKKHDSTVISTSNNYSSSIIESDTKNEQQHQQKPEVVEEEDPDLTDVSSLSSYDNDCEENQQKQRLDVNGLEDLNQRWDSECSRLRFLWRWLQLQISELKRQESHCNDLIEHARSSKQHIVPQSAIDEDSNECMRTAGFVKLEKYRHLCRKAPPALGPRSTLLNDDSKVHPLFSVGISKGSTKFGSAGASSPISGKLKRLKTLKKRKRKKKTGLRVSVPKNIASPRKFKTPKSSSNFGPIGSRRSNSRVLRTADFDIDSIVIPYNMSTPTSISIPEYHEIHCPTWRDVSSPFALVDIPIRRKPDNDENEDEDTSDEAYALRHAKMELEERLRYVANIRQRSNPRSEKKFDDLITTVYVQHDNLLSSYSPVQSQPRTPFGDFVHFKASKIQQKKRGFKLDKLRHKFSKIRNSLFTKMGFNYPNSSSIEDIKSKILMDSKSSKNEKENHPARRISTRKHCTPPPLNVRRKQLLPETPRISNANRKSAPNSTRKRDNSGGCDYIWEIVPKKPRRDPHTKAVKNVIFLRRSRTN